jgi:hypothetical protein
LLHLDILLHYAWGKEVFFHIEITVMSDEYRSQLIDFGLVFIAEAISVAQLFGNVMPCLTFIEKNLVGLPLEVLRCLQEGNNVVKIILEVLCEELIHDFKHFSNSLIIELNFNMLINNLPLFFFFLMGNILSIIDYF